MKHTANNLMLFRKNFNHLYHFIRNRDRNEEDYRIIPTRSGYPNLEIKLENQQASSLYSKYDPIYETEQWIGKSLAEISETKNIFLYGFGLGYHLERIIEHFPDKLIYVIEPDVEVVLAAMEARDLSAILKHPNIAVFAIGKDTLTLYNFAAAVSQKVTDSFTTLYIPAYTKRYAQEADAFTKVFHSVVLNDRTNLLTQSFFKQEWPENIMLNLAKTVNGRSVHDLQNEFEDYTVFVVGSGPSLDADIEYIKQMQNKALIFAAGSSTRALLKYGIRPHLIVSIDGNEKNYEVFKDLDLKGIPMVYASYVKYKIVDDLKDDLYHVFIGSDSITSYIMDIQETTKQFFTTASVTGTVIQLAAMLGCKKMVLIGQDLSYPGEEIYSSSVDHFDSEEIGNLRKTAIEMVENVRGGQNPTSKPMRNTLENIEMLVAAFGNEIEFINTSQIGAKITGTRNQNIAEIAAELMNESALEDMSPERFRIFMKDKTKEYSEEKKNEVRAAMKKVSQEIKRIYETTLTDIVKQLDLIKIQIEKGQEKQLPMLLNRINELWGKLTSHKLFDPVIGFIFQAEISIYSRYISMILRADNNFKKSELVVAHLGKLVTAMYQVLPRFEFLVNTALERMEQEASLKQGETYV